MNKEIGIYWIRNKITNKRYIGATINLKSRLNQHKNELKRGVHGNHLLQEEFNKCSLEDFEFKVLVNCPQKLLDTMERSFIEFYKDKCYNLDSGGRQNFSRDTSTIEKMSGENHPFFGKTGENNPNFGRTHTKEARQRISKAMSGENHPFFGKTGENHPGFGRTGEKNPMFGRTGDKHPFFGRTHSDEAREKISRANSGENNPNFGRTGEKHPRYGKTHTTETKRKMSGENHPSYIQRTPELLHQAKTMKWPDFQKLYDISRRTYSRIRRELKKGDVEQ
jgi:group I intron endonuclease